MKLNEYLDKKINNIYPVLNRKSVKGTKTDYNYETWVIYDMNGEEDFYIQCDREHLEALRPLFKGVKQHTDHHEYYGDWSWRDMEDMLDNALNSNPNSKYFCISLKLWDDGSDETFNDKGWFPYKYYGIEDLGKKMLYIGGAKMDKRAHKYYKELNITDWEETCANIRMEDW